MHVPMPKNPRVALFVPTMRCGGAERMMAHLAITFESLGVPVDLVLGSAEGPFLKLLPNSVRVIDLQRLHMQHAIIRLARYYSHERPFGLCSPLSLGDLRRR